MKKWISFIVVALLTMNLVACGTKEKVSGSRPEAVRGEVWQAAMQLTAAIERQVAKKETYDDINGAPLANVVSSFSMNYKDASKEEEQLMLDVFTLAMNGGLFTFQAKDNVEYKKAQQKLAKRFTEKQLKTKLVNDTFKSWKIDQ